MSQEMAVESSPWKRKWILKNHPHLKRLFGDAAGLRRDSAFCYIAGERVPVPQCDILTVGFSCKTFSSLRARGGESIDRVVLEGKGSSGATCAYALDFVGRFRPGVLIIENVVGLFKGYLKRDAVTWDSVIDTHSNLHILLSTLRGFGYCAPKAILDPSPRIACHRKRVWLPCFLLSAPMDDDTADHLAALVEELLSHLQQKTTSCIHLPALLLDTDFADYKFWERAAVSGNGAKVGAERSRSLWLTPDPDSIDQELKYKALHCKVFAKGGLSYPPVLSNDMMSLRARCGLSQREAEILHYFDVVAPMSLVCDKELFLDLSQGINRQRVHGNILPCITPNARIWKRRARAWLLAPEAMRAQGYDEVLAPALKEFTHRQVELGVACCDVVSIGNDIRLRLQCSNLSRISP